MIEEKIDIQGKTGKVQVLTCCALASGDLAQGSPAFPSQVQEGHNSLRSFPVEQVRAWHNNESSQLLFRECCSLRIKRSSDKRSSDMAPFLLVA